MTGAARFGARPSGGGVLEMGEAGRDFKRAAPAAGKEGCQSGGIPVSPNLGLLSPVCLK